MVRDYKDAEPIDTIKQAREMLRKAGIFTYEKVWFSPHNNVYSTAIKTEQQYGSFQTNGKGQSRGYCLASAYGEMLERLQNNTHIMTTPPCVCEELNRRCGYYSYPDEKFLDEKDIESLPSDILNDLFGDTNYSDYVRIAKKKNNRGCLAVPFYDVGKNAVTYLPYNPLVTITGSNGMSAGNSANEAIYQALFEIFERWATSIVFYKRLTPPTVSDHTLKQYHREFSVLKDIQSCGLKILVKDFSCGIGLPVLGLIAIDEASDRYFLNVGSDSSFQVALSRCITELYQGVGSIEKIKGRMIQIPRNDSEVSAEERISHLLAFMADGSGSFPQQLFKEQSSYAENIGAFVSHATFQEECRYWAANLMNRGYSLYVRDVSFFGFPAYHIYVPNVSSSLPDGYIAMKRLESKYQVECAIESCFKLHSKEKPNKVDLQKIESVFKELDYNGWVDEICGIELELTEEAYCHRLSVANFLAVIALLRGKPKTAMGYIDRYREVVKDDRSYCLSKRLGQLSITMLSSRTLSSWIKSLNSVCPICESIVAYHQAGEKKLQQVAWALNLPACPTCNNCPLLNHCLTIGRCKLTYMMSSTYKENALKIKQKNLYSVF